MDICEQESNLKQAYDIPNQCGQAIISVRSPSFEQRLKQERDGLLRELSKIQNKNDLLEKQPQYVLDTIDEVTKY